jgi:hypothetical protein
MELKYRLRAHSVVDKILKRTSTLDIF